MTDPGGGVVQRTATAASQPCRLHVYHSPVPSRTQRHHRKPEYLQRRVWGVERDDVDVMWLCGTCHDNVHEWLSWLLGEARRPDPEPGRLAKAEAGYAFDWYTGLTPA